MIILYLFVSRRVGGTLTIVNSKGIYELIKTLFLLKSQFKGWRWKEIMLSRTHFQDQQKEIKN